MQVVHPVCCGIAVHQAQLTACLRRVSDDGQSTTELRTFDTTYSALLALSDWLVAADCPVVAMESTGVYWKPVYHVLAATVEGLVGNAREMRPRPGHKTDPADARWIADLLAHGLIRPRFLPPPALSAWRDLTRTRVALVQTRTQAKNRVHKVLEDTNIKLSSVVTALFGTSGRRMLEALIAGERDATTLATRALGKLRRKLPQRELALAGQCTAPHARLIQGALARIDLLDRHIAELDHQMGELVEPLQPQSAQLDSLPGVDVIAARAIVAETGTDRSRCGSATRLSAWASVSPGHHERAGKRRHGRTRPGHRYVRRVWVQCAWAARNTPTFLGRTFRRLAARLGGKKAAVAGAHQSLVLVYHRLAEGTCDDEQRYAHLQSKQEARRRRQAVKMLESLGYQVVLEPMA